MTKSRLRFSLFTLIGIAVAPTVLLSSGAQPHITVSATVMDQHTLAARIVACDEAGPPCSALLVRLEPGEVTSVDSMPLTASGPVRRLRGTISATTSGALAYDLQFYTGARLAASASTSSKAGSPNH